MSTRLKALLQQHRITQVALATATSLSRPLIVAICNHGVRSAAERAARKPIEEFLKKRGIAVEGVFRKEKAVVRANAPRPVRQSHQSHQQERAMLRKQVINPKARQHFGLTRDPFADPVEPADVYRSSSINFVREAISDKVKHGGFLAVIAESGAGKSIIREETVERFRNDGKVQFIEPYVLASALDEVKGKTLKVGNIIEAILSKIAPSASPRSSPNARAEQTHAALRESARAGYRNCLLIEEAHDLFKPTLKSLKRFLELKDGMRSLLSVVLVGQPELLKRLSENDLEVREVMQRLEIVYVPPLDNDLRPFLEHRFQRVGVPLDRVVDAAAVEAIRQRLTPTGQRGGTSLLYPLAVQNLLAAAMNAVAELGAPKVTAEAVREVLR